MGQKEVGTLDCLRADKAPYSLPAPGTIHGRCGVCRGILHRIKLVIYKTKYTTDGPNTRLVLGADDVQKPQKYP
jgi:hypothetical protein